jgi:hypothetical protein
VSPRANVEYKVLLVFPGFGDERDNAEQVLEEALNYLNTQKDEPGMRFAQNVSARLEIVADADQAAARLQTEDDLALLILHDLDDEEKTALTAECSGMGVPVCHTVNAEAPPRRPRGKPREWKVVFKKGGGDEPRAHKILANTLTASLEGDQEELMDRVGQLIALLALGVMEFHWTRNPPRRLSPE